MKTMQEIIEANVDKYNLHKIKLSGLSTKDLIEVHKHTMDVVNAIEYYESRRDIYVSYRGDKTDENIACEIDSYSYKMKGYTYDYICEPKELIS